MFALRDTRGVSAPLVAATVVAAMVVGIGWYAISVGTQPPRGPVAVAWDQQTCAHCGMHIGDPAFAAQLHLEDGEVLHFDDAGCLFRWRAEHPLADVHEAYFHHYEEKRWLDGDEVGFLRVAQSPMGSGLAAVEARRAGALTLEEARTAVLGAEAQR